MNNRLHFLLVSLLFVASACVQRSDAPPASSRDGIAGGTNTPPKQEARAPQGNTEQSADLPVLGYEERFELGDNQYTVLVGTFPTEQQAQEVSYLLRMNRISNFIDHVNDDWLVCIGKYGSAKGAQKMLAFLYRKGAVRQLQQTGYPDPTVHGPGHTF
jgi:hypothetical protein